MSWNEKSISNVPEIVDMMSTGDTVFVFSEVFAEFVMAISSLDVFQYGVVSGYL